MNATTCRRCKGAIVWAQGDRGWVPLEPASAREHVVGDDGKPIYDPKLGHRRHDCTSAGRAQQQRPGTTTVTIDDDRPLDELEEALIVARSQVDAALTLIARIRGRSRT